MDDPFKSRLLVCARGIEVWVRELSDLADHGDAEAAQALDKLRDGFEAARKALGKGPEWREDEFVAIYDGLLILEDAMSGRSRLPHEMLRRIVKQLNKDLKHVGLEPLDEGGFFEVLEGGG